jgi:hypothetical protein
VDRATIVSVGDHSKEVFHHTNTSAVFENLHRIARVLTPKIGLPDFHTWR